MQSRNAVSMTRNSTIEERMKRKTLLLSAALIVSALTGAAAQRGPGRGGPPGGRCAMTADSLTDSQKGQVKSLVDAFTQSHAAQLDSLRTIMQAANAARQAGQTPDEVRAIMDQGRPINDSLAPARKEFHDNVVKLLTQAQIDAGCIPPAPGGPPGGRRGGPPIE